MADSTFLKPPMFDRTSQPYPVTSPAMPYPPSSAISKPQPPILVQTPGNCSCDQGGSGFEAKIKENPLLFVIGAVVLGYFLAKK